MKKINYVLLLGFVLIAPFLKAQDINSPYSRYGVGRLYGKDVSTSLWSMGGISYGIANPFIVNVANPASYGSFDSLTFVFQTGITGNVGTLKNTQTSSGYNYASLNHVAVGFPVTKWWRSSLGVIPYSKVGYDTQVKIAVKGGYTPFLDNRWGKGALAEIYWGNGFNITKNLRLGVNLNYLFGNKRSYNIAYSADSLNVFGAKTENYMWVGGLLYDWGLQYDIHIKNNHVLTLGVVYSNKSTVSAYRSILATTLTGGYGTNVDVVRDTVKYVARENGNLLIPGSFGAGFSYRNKNLWLIGADVQFQNWNNFRSFGITDSLSNSFRIAIGGQYTPKHSNISPLAKRMTYRMGLKFNQSYLHLNGFSINEFALTGGVQFPFKRTRTNLSLGFEIGSRGTLKNNLIRESFFNFTFGINIVQNWFYKRKYR